MRTKDFYLYDLDGPGNKLDLSIGWDGDITVSVIDDHGRLHGVRIGMSPNSGDPNDDVEDIQYVKLALRNLMREFMYQRGEISKEEINKYRNNPMILPKII